MFMIRTRIGVRRYRYVIVVSKTMFSIKNPNTVMHADMTSESIVNIVKGLLFVENLTSNTIIMNRSMNITDSVIF